MRLDSFLALSLAALLVTTSVASAQVAPGSDPSPGSDHRPAAPRPPSPAPLPPEQRPVPQPGSPLDGPRAPNDPAPRGTEQPPKQPPVVVPPTPAAEDGTPADMPPPTEPARPVAEPPPPPVYQRPEAEDPAVTSARWESSWRFDLQWDLLMLPEHIINVLFTPFELLTTLIQRKRLDQRFGDLLDIKSIGIKISPRFKFSFGDGAGAGLWFKHDGLFDDRASFKIGGLVRLNADWQLEARYAHSLLLPGGRGLRARAFIEKDRNQRYYGIGGESVKADRRVLGSMEEGGVVEVDLQGIDRYTYSGIAQLGIRRQTLEKGDDSAYTPVGGMGDNVLPPVGFNETATYVDAQIVGRRDSRDTAGRPMRGLLIEAAVLARSDITGQNLSAVTGSAAARLFIPVLANRRVLVFTIAGAAAAPLFPGDDIPLDSLAVVGRSNVRGYDRERFRDKYAVISSAEYRFPIYEYLQSQAGLDAFVFLDAGTIWGTTPFSLNPLRYSYGGGIRGGHETTQVFEVTLGRSPEGFQFNVGVESVL